MATYNKSLIFKYAWRLFKGQNERTMEAFSLSLRSAWTMAKTNPKGLLPILKVVKVKEVLTFNEAYSKYYDAVLRYANKLVYNDTVIAEEIASDSFLKIYRAFAEYDSTASTMKTWMFKITYNTFVDYNRKHKLNTVSISDNVDENGNETLVLSDVVSTDAELIDAELMQSINKAFESIQHSEHRHIASLYFIEQKRVKEIADMCDIPESTVKVTLMRCKALLQAQLQAERQAYSIG